jgi:DNA-directed DNA polymerase III PolC
MASSFVPLRSRSRGSLLRGAADPARLASAAAERGYEALALTDRDGLYGAIAFVKAAREQGVRPLLGVELGPGTAGKRAAAEGARGDREACLVALARDREGYASLCRLVTARHLAGAGDSLEDSCARAGPGLHLVALDALCAGRLVTRRQEAAEDGDVEGARSLARVWLGVSRPGPGGSQARAAEEAARRLGVPAVAVGEVSFLDPTEPEVEELLTAVRTNDMLGARTSRARLAPGHLAGAHEEAQRWAPFRTLLDNNRRLAADCRLDIELGVPRFPAPPLPAGETGYARLYRLCQEGLARRYPTPPRAAVRRLAVELDLIDRLGFTPYFLLVADIVGFARAGAIPTVGRGSGASSLVAYVLGITNVDPVRYRLAFERFLHPARRDCPDLDIDLCWRRRDEVIEHVYTAYGAERVAMISTHCTLGARAAFREAARASGIAPTQVDRVSKLVPRDAEGPGSVRAALEADPRGRTLLAERGGPWSAICARASHLVGLVDHLGIHPGGLVIADTALTDYLPLEPATKGIVVSQYEMHAVEAVGLVKMDLLGNRALTEIGDTLDLVAERTGVRPVLDPPPDGDAQAAALIAQGDTLGCFQLESPGMRNLLRMLAARSVDETIAAVALIRPGPAGSGMKDAYVKRARGLEPARYLHPRLEPLLAENYGVLLYEEDVMAVAAALADWTLAEGDLFRRALVGAKSLEEREPVRRLFLARLAERGVDAEVARAAWEDLSRFAAYAFCKAHAAGYGVLAYQAAYLKARWPAAFAVALLANHAGMYPLWVHVADAERRGVRFRLPCVNRSQNQATLEPEGDPETGPVRLGLSSVRDLSEATRTRLVRTRDTEGAFASLADFTARARPSLTEAQNLIASGALDVLGRTRASLRCEAQATHARYGDAEDEGAFRVRRSPVAVPDLPEFEPARLGLLEWQTLRLGVRAHPLELASPDLAPPGEPPWSLEARKRARSALGLAPAADMERRVGERVRVAGLVAAARRVETVRGDRMLFLTLDDGTGLVECTLFPEAYRRAMGRLSGLGPFVAEGRVESAHGAVTLTAERVERWRV